jgi:hypothetical protein
MKTAVPASLSIPKCVSEGKSTVGALQVSNIGSVVNCKFLNWVSGEVNGISMLHSSIRGGLFHGSIGNVLLEQGERGRNPSQMG